MFLAIDGIDGSGKTTLAESLGNAFSSLDPLITKEPTDDSIWGRRLRTSAKEGRLPRELEIEYFHKDRINHIQRTISPALDSGRLVICDRYVDSTLAFQANDPAEADRLLERFEQEILTPDLTLILECPVEVGLERISRNRAGRTTFEKTETLLRASEIYRSRHRANYRHVNSHRTPEAVFYDAFYLVVEKLVHERNFDEDLFAFGEYQSIMPKALSNRSCLKT